MRLSSNKFLKNVQKGVFLVIPSTFGRKGKDNEKSLGIQGF